jgi:hypothetical protein
VNSITEPTEVRRDWRTILREQGRSMAWLALQTESSYNVVVNYVYRRTPTPEAWEKRVYELLGEGPR